MKIFNEEFEEIRDKISEICKRNSMQIRFHEDGSYIIEYNDSQKETKSNSAFISNSDSDSSPSDKDYGHKDLIDKDYSGTITDEMLKGTRFENGKHKFVLEKLEDAR